MPVLSYIPDDKGGSSNKSTTSYTGFSTKELISMLAAFLLLLILVEHYPRIIIGFMLLILVSVLLFHSNTIASLFA